MLLLRRRYGEEQKRWKTPIPNLYREYNETTYLRRIYKRPNKP